jgi:hypothetical protein
VPTRTRRIYEPVVDLPTVIVPQTQRSEFSGDKVFDEDIGFMDEFVDDGEAVGVLEVDCNRSFVSIHHEKVSGFWAQVGGL